MKIKTRKRLKINPERSPINILKLYLKYKKITKTIDNKINGSINCPSCTKLILFKDKTEEQNIKCPKCKLNILIKNPKEEKPDLQEPETYIYKPSLRSKIFGITLLILGLMFMINPEYFNIKLSLTFIIIGVSIYILLTDKKFIIIPQDPDKNINSTTSHNKIKDFENNLFDIYDKITLSTVILVLFLFIITGDTNTEIFLILVYLGFLMIKEFTKDFVPRQLKGRMNILLVTFLGIFIVIIANKMISVISI